MSKQLSFEDIRPDHDERVLNINLKRSPISLLLDGMMDQQNIGGLFRTADAARIKEIVLYRCPIEISHKKFKKTARATRKFVPYRIIENKDTLQQYAATNRLISVEYTDDSTLLHKTEIDLPATLVLGNERYGVSKELLAMSEKKVHLPMLGIQTSMNVCTAGSIAMYEILRRL